MIATKDLKLTMRELRLDSNNASYNDEALRNSYKKIKFKPNLQDNQNWVNAPKKTNKQSKSVSFNTVPSILGVSSYEDNFAGLQLPSSLDFRKTTKKTDNVNNLTFNSYNNIDKMFIITPEGKIVRKDYPSRPTIINDAMIINKFYLNWLERWQDHKLQIDVRLTNKSIWFKYPDIIIPTKKVKPIMMDEDYVPLTKNQKRERIVLTTKIPSVNLPRTIICHINGRKHTWVALDWLLDISLHDMDHLIILTNIPRVKMCHKSLPQNQHDNFWGDSLIYEQSHIFEIIHNILNYTHLLLSKHNRSVKVTVDIVIGKTKKVLIDAINLYTPDLIVVPTLKWERNAKLIEHKSSYLKDNLCINFPIPVCIVPARRLYQFELNLQEKINNCKQFDSMKTITQDDFNENDMALSSPFSSSNSSLDSINSFTADYNSEMTTISDTFSNTCKEKDNKYKDQFDTLTDDQFLLDIQDLPIVSQLYLVAKRCRRHMQEEIERLENAKSHITKKQYLVGKLDCVLNTSVEGSLMINNIKGNKLSNDVDLKGFARLKRVITGGEPTYLPSPKPMTDVSGYKSPRNKLSPLRQSRIASPKKGASQIIFASDVKIQDGRKALGNWRANRSSSSNTTSQPTSPKVPAIIKRVPSTDEIRSIHSNDSVKSTMSATSDFLYPKRLQGFNPTTKKSTSTPSSRRGSNSSDKSQISVSGGKRKMISKLFGFK